MLSLDFRQDLPLEITRVSIDKIRQVFANPTLISLPGKLKKPLFLSLLLHGNETTSFKVLQELAEYINDFELPRDLIIFVGNVAAAEMGVRYLSQQADFNRIWDESATGPEAEIARAVKAFVLEHGPFHATIDIHNNTGKNPYYACVNRLEQDHVYLASLFSPTLVFYRTPASALSLAFSKHGPSVTLECGKSGQAGSANKAFQYIMDVMRLDSLEHQSPKADHRIYQTVAKIVVDESLNFGFHNCDAQLCFKDDLEDLNFSPLPTGHVIAHVTDHHQPLKVLDENGDDQFDDYFQISEGQLVLKKPIIPSMLTKNKDVIRQDCLGYIMRKLNI